MTDGLIDKSLSSATWPIQEKETTCLIINTLQDLVIDLKLLWVHPCPVVSSSSLFSFRVIVKLLSNVVIVLHCSPRSLRVWELEMGKVTASLLEEWANEEKAIIGNFILSCSMDLVCSLQYTWQVITNT
jgi:hypothetical protein